MGLLSNCVADLSTEHSEKYAIHEGLNNRAAVVTGDSTNEEMKTLTSQGEINGRDV
jgi:hypothetical protein